MSCRINLSVPVLFLTVSCCLFPSVAAAQDAKIIAAEHTVQEGGTPLVGWLKLEGTLSEGPPPFAWLPAEQAGASMQSVLKQLQTVAGDEQYVGLVVYLDRPLLTTAQIDDLAAAIDAVRASGKHVMAFAEEYSLSTYLLACSADTILLQRKGVVQLAMPLLTLS